MKTIAELKTELASLVARKMELTRERVAYKRATPSSHERGAVLRGMWSECSTQKEQIRLILLALAFVRGRRYWHVERDVHEQHRVYPRAVARAAGADEVEVKAWLAEKPTAEEQAAWATHLEVAKGTARLAGMARRQQRTLQTMGLAAQAP